MDFYSYGVGWVRIVLAGSQSRLYPHMRAKFGRDPTAASKKVAFKFISRYKRQMRLLLKDLHPPLI